MPNWRAIQAKGLAKIHAHLSVPAVYLTHAAGTPIRLTVQRHINEAKHENEFTFVTTPGLLDLTPRLEFDMSDIPTAKVMPDALVFLSPTEVYRTGPARPIRDGYCEVEVMDPDASMITEFTAPFASAGYGDEWAGIYP